eukprot:13895371-Ditylum_brightwellii.AAC.1
MELPASFKMIDNIKVKDDIFGNEELTEGGWSSKKQRKNKNWNNNNVEIVKLDGGHTQGPITWK